MNDEYMTIPELMVYMHISRKTAYRLVASGVFPVCRLSPRKTLIKRSDIDAYLAKHTY